MAHLVMANLLIALEGNEVSVVEARLGRASCGQNARATPMAFWILDFGFWIKNQPALAFLK
jgi:hypothetical protein